MTTDGDEIPAVEGLSDNLRDDVRAFLLQQLPWNQLTSSQREHLRQLGEDKKMRRPTYLAVESNVDDVPLQAMAERCHIGAEGVMAHADETCVHLAFKCGNPEHVYHYSTFGIDTIVALAKACEVAWPGTISRNLVKHPRPCESAREPDDDDNLVLDPGDDSVDLTGADECDEDEHAVDEDE